MPEADGRLWETQACKCTQKQHHSRVSDLSSCLCTMRCACEGRHILIQRTQGHMHAHTLTRTLALLICFAFPYQRVVAVGDGREAMARVFMWDSGRFCDIFRFWFVFFCVLTIHMYEHVYVYVYIAGLEVVCWRSGKRVPNEQPDLSNTILIFSPCKFVDMYINIYIYIFSNTVPLLSVLVEIDVVTHAHILAPFFLVLARSCTFSVNQQHGGRDQRTQ